MLKYASEPKPDGPKRKKKAPVDQGSDRRPVTPEATGSNPVGRATTSASVAQRIDRPVPDREDAGSNPAGRANYPGKKLISVRVDVDVIEHFRAGGPGWQTRVNAALRRRMELDRGEGFI